MSDLILPSNTARTDDLAALRTLAAGGTIGAMNYATGMGMPMYDPSRHTNMAAGVVPLDRGQQDRLMRSHKFIRKIIETIPNQMTYRWGHLTLGGDDGDPDTINEVHTWLDNLNTKSLVNRYKGLKRAFNQAMKMAFQTGNAALVILAKDGQNFDRPINTNNLKSIEGLFLADRWSIQPDISGIYANLEMAEYFWLNDSRFNKIIQLRGGDMGRIRIHRSRVLWFRGEELSDRTLLENEGCDDSVLQGVQQSFQEYFQAVRGAGRMIVDFDVVVHKVANLLANIDNDPSGKYQQKMMERAQINNICRSIWRSMIIDLESEDIVHSTRNVSGYDSLLDRLVLDLQANTDLTKAELFNEYSKGLSATDKVEQENANNRTRMYQESKLDSNMYDFLKLVFACKEGPTKGKEPDKWEWKWEELYPVTPVEQAELELMRSQIDQINSSIGAYTGEEAAKSHYSGSEYNPEITIDWEEREKLKVEQEKQQAEADKLAIQMGLLPGMEQPLIPGQPKQKALPGQQPGKALPGAKDVTDSDDGFWPPLQVQAIAKKGLELFKQYGSSGSPNIMQSVFWSRHMAYGQQIPRNAVFYIKQQNDLMRIPPGGDDPKRPSYEFIAYLCRGGAAGKVWIEQMVKELAIQEEAIGQVDSEASVHMDKPCGKGFIANHLNCNKTPVLSQKKLTSKFQGRVEVFEDADGNKRWLNTPGASTNYETLNTNNVPNGLENADSDAPFNVVAAYALDINQAIALMPKGGFNSSIENEIEWHKAILQHSLPFGGIVTMQADPEFDPDGSRTVQIAEAMGLEKAKYRYIERTREIVPIDELRRNGEMNGLTEFLESQVKPYENIYVGKYNAGKISSPNHKEEIKTIQSIHNLKWIGILDRLTEEREEKLADERSTLEDKYLGRNPTKIKSLKTYENKAKKWAEEQFGAVTDGANGFTLEQTLAHDVAHPIVHEMLKSSTDGINKRFGSALQNDGRPSLVLEEAIVNVAEHLSRGDSIDASILNGVRLAKVLSRNKSIQSDAVRQQVRSPHFVQELAKMSHELYKHNNFSLYMKYIRETNRISRTVRLAGDDFTNSASGG